MKKLITAFAILASVTSFAKVSNEETSIQYGVEGGTQVTITNDGAFIDGQFISWSNTTDSRLVFVKGWKNGVKTQENCIVVEKKAGVTTVVVNKYLKNTAKFCPKNIVYTKTGWAGVTFVPVVKAKQVVAINTQDIIAVKDLILRLSNEEIEEFDE